MQNALYIEIPEINRTFMLTGYSELWKSTQQCTLCDTLKAVVDKNTNAVSVVAHFESNGGIKMCFVNMPVAIIWQS